MKKKHLLIPVIVAAMAAVAAPIISSRIAPVETPVHAESYPTGKQVKFVGEDGNTYDFDGGVYARKNDGTEGSLIDYNIAYLSGSGTIMLNGFSGRYIKSTSSYPLTIQLANKANDNKLKPIYDGTTAIYGINCSGPLTINGNGTLKITLNNSVTDAYDNVDINKAVDFYGIYAYGGVTIGNSDTDVVDLEISAVNACKYKYGIYAANSGKIDVIGGANIQLTMSSNNKLYGLCSWNGDIDLNISKDKSISTTLYTDSINNGKPEIHGMDAKKDVTVTGQGTLELKNTSPSANYNSYGIYLNADSGDYHRVKFHSLNKVKLTNFYRSIYVMGNGTDGSDSDNYDVVIYKVSDFSISSNLEDNYGFRLADDSGSSKVNYGIQIEDSKVTYNGDGSPIYCKGDNGLNILGESMVSFFASKYSYLREKSCDIALSYGYFILADYATQTECSNDLYGDYFYVRLAKNNYAVHPSWTSDKDNDDGGYLYRIDKDNYSYPFMVRGISKTISDSINTISLDGVSLTKDKPYFVNGESSPLSPSSITSGYNAYFDFDKAILRLNGYKGGKIYYDCNKNDPFRIEVIKDSEINAKDDLYGIGLVANGSLEIVSEDSSLKINVSNTSKDVAGIYSLNGSIDIFHNAKVVINATADNTYSARGIYAKYGDVHIYDYADLSITNSSTNTSERESNSAIYAGGNVYINTYKSDDYASTIDLDSRGVKTGSYAIYAESSLEIACVELMSIQWKEVGSKCGPFYPTDALDSATMLVINMTEDGYMSILPGIGVQLEMTNGYIYCPDNFLACVSCPEFLVPKYSSCFIIAEAIDGVEFVEWDVSDLSVFTDEDYKKAAFSLISDITSPISIEATYNFVKGGQPKFDSRGKTTEGYVSFELFGKPEQTRLVKAVGDEDEKAYPSDQFSYKNQLTPDVVKAGDYRIAAQYKTAIGNYIWLFTDKFTITYNQAAVDYEMNFYPDEKSVQSHIISTKFGDFEMPDYNDIESFEEEDSKRFTGWKDKENSSVVYKAGDVIKDVHCDMNFEPTFEDRTEYIVSYDSNGGTGSMANKNIYDGRYLTLPECEFGAPDGYEFDHWEIGKEKYDAEETYQVSANVTVKAIWSEISSEEPSSSTQPTSSPSSQTPGSQPTSGAQPTSGSTPSEPITSDPSAPIAPGSSGVTPSSSEVPAPSEEESGGGISGGAVAGIVIGSLALVGLGGFSVYWFVISKKTIGELGNVFVKGFNATKNFFTKIFKPKSK